MDNPEKLATYVHKKGKKHNTTQYELGTTMRKQTQMT